MHSSRLLSSLTCGCGLVRLANRVGNEPVGQASHAPCLRHGGPTTRVRGVARQCAIEASEARSGSTMHNDYQAVSGAYLTNSLTHWQASLSSVVQPWI